MGTQKQQQKCPKGPFRWKVHGIQRMCHGQNMVNMFPFNEIVIPCRLPIYEVVAPPGSVCCFITPMNYSYDDHKPEWSTFIVNKPTPRESLTASPSFQDIPTYHHYKSL